MCVRFKLMKIFLSFFLLIPLFVNAENLRKHKGYGQFKFDTYIYDFIIKGNFDYSNDFITCVDCSLMITGVHRDLNDTKGTSGISSCRDVIPGFFKTQYGEFAPRRFKSSEKFIADEIILFRDVVTPLDEWGTVNGEYGPTGKKYYTFNPEDKGICNIGVFGNVEFFSKSRKYSAKVEDRPAKLFSLSYSNRVKLEDEIGNTNKVEYEQKIIETENSKSNEASVTKESVTKNEISSESNIDICIDLGFKKGTEDLKNCVLELY